MMSLLLFLIFVLKVSGHDPTKCRADASGKQSCCATKGRATCADFYTLTWGQSCEEGEFQGHQFFCKPMSGSKELHDKIIKEHDATRCQVSEQRNSKCCSFKGLASCSNNHTLTWGDQCFKVGGYTGYRFFCTAKYDESIRTAIKSYSDPSKCLNRDVYDPSCCSPYE